MQEEGRNVKSLIQIGIEIQIENEKISQKINSVKSDIKVLEDKFQSKLRIIKEKQDKIGQNQDEIKQLETRHQSAEHQIKNLQQMTSVLQGVIAEKEANLKLIKEKRAKMKKHQNNILNSHQQKWEAYYTFYQSMPEAQNYVRLKSELIIKEEEMKSLKKTGRDIEKETQISDKDLMDEFQKKIVKIAKLKCETVKMEKTILDEIKAKQSSSSAVTNVENSKEEIAKSDICQFTFPIHFQNNFTAAPTIPSPAPAKQIGMIARAATENSYPSQTNKFFSPPEINMVVDQSFIPNKSQNNYDQTPHSHISTNSTQSTPQFLSVEPFGQKNTNPLFGGPFITDVPSQSFSFDWNTPSTGFQLNFGDKIENSLFTNGILRFENTPEEDQPSSSGFLMQLGDE